TEIIGNHTESGCVGVLATNGTVLSGSYPMEIKKFFPDLTVYQEACPMWVPLVENNESDGHGADFFVRKNLACIFKTEPKIDVILLACTHYPLLKDKIEEYLPIGVKLISQGEIVAASLRDYLQRHPEMENKCSKNRQRVFYTTDSTEDFDNHATIFFGQPVQSKHLDLG
ncbi:MAG: glutamate racemase, partial [Chitinophagaceae bacterium]|nr:glutamate racemase [Chitinophagaceae bacterium]